MTLAALDAPLADAPTHAPSFRYRRFWNWFPMGLTYAFLYMGRYNLTVAKNALGDLMTKEDFGVIFGVGTVTYGLAFLLNGPLTDRIGGKRSLLVAAFGAALMNAAMGTYLAHVLAQGQADAATLRRVFAALYAANMYFQSFGAVAIVKVNAHWFHVRERGGFSGIFGAMIASGIFFAFTVNAWVLDYATTHGGGASKTFQARWVFFVPAALLGLMGLVETWLLRDRPAQAGLRDFDTGDGEGGDGAGGADPAGLWPLFKRVLANPVLQTIALIEFCTGVLRNGVMHWYPIYVTEVSALPSNHYLNNGSWGAWYTVWPFFAASGAIFLAAALLAPAARGRARRAQLTLGAALALAPFLQGGWGGIQMVAGIIGGMLAGYVSDWFFQSRRAPAAAGLYALLVLGTLAMGPTLGKASTTVESSRLKGLEPGDRITSVAGRAGLDSWADVQRAFRCVPAPCRDGAAFDAATCLCSSHPERPADEAPSPGTLELGVERAGQALTLRVADPAFRPDPEGGPPRPALRAGDARRLAASPRLTLSPYWLGAVVFLLSLAVIGTHGLLSGTATMDFGGRRAAATAVGVIDGCVYLGTAVQSFSLGYLTSRDWAYWPWFLVPFAAVGLLLCFRIWNARPKGSAPAH
ncbi:MAG TPA: MFS transporter [Polyangiaceae bacterium]|nr:MFS transporter [Polyangiaceae bacterium]